MRPEFRIYPLTGSRAQTLLESLYSLDVNLRLDAIRQARALPRQDARVMQALTELAALDREASVRSAADRVLREWEERATRN